MIGIQRLELEGKRFVVIEESEYERLCREASEEADAGDLPEFPKPDKRGRFPRAGVHASLDRSRLDPRSQECRLESGAPGQIGRRPEETISRLESGKHLASAATIEKLETRD